MLHIFLCEDNKEQRDYFSKIIQNIILIEDYDLKLACVASEPQHILDKAKTLSGTGLYFLDIELKNDMNGLLLAQQLRHVDPRGYIVFVTTHSELSYMTFTYKVEALDFILKDNLQDLHKRFHQCIIDAYQKYTSPFNYLKKTFTITNADKEYCIPMDEIIFFETSENKHKLLLHTNTKIYEFSSSMKLLVSSLDERFTRCHRSYIINQEHISSINLKNRTITMTNQDICLASNKYLKTLKK